MRSEILKNLHKPLAGLPEKSQRSFDRLLNDIAEKDDLLAYDFKIFQLRLAMSLLKQIHEEHNATYFPIRFKTTDGVREISRLTDNKEISMLLDLILKTKTEIAMNRKLKSDMTMEEYDCNLKHHQRLLKRKLEYYNEARIVLILRQKLYDEADIVLEIKTTVNDILIE